MPKIILPLVAFVVELSVKVPLAVVLPLICAIVGVVSVGDVAKTNEPLPVSSVTAASKFALLGVVRNVATPVPSPLTPVLIGKPVQLVNVPLLGVPSTGVVSVGDVSVLLVKVSVFAMSDTVPAASGNDIARLAVCVPDSVVINPPPKILNVLLV